MEYSNKNCVTALKGIKQIRFLLYNMLRPVLFLTLIWVNVTGSHFTWSIYEIHSFSVVGKTLSESRSTIGPKLRPTLGRFAAWWEITGEIKSGSMVLGRKDGQDGEKDSDLQ